MTIRTFCIAFCSLVLSTFLATTEDKYPGDLRYTEIVQELLESVRSDSMNFDWPGRYDVTKQELCSSLSRQHFEQKNEAQLLTNMAWLASADLSQGPLVEACLAALSEQKSSASSSGWEAWQGDHRGVWYSPQAQFQDAAHWSEPSRESAKGKEDLDRNGDLRIYELQSVYWPGRRVGQYGWNQSHPEVDYVWGWDPKESGNENGQIGAHLGFPFEYGSVKWLVWVTPKTAFLEGVDTSKQVSRTVNDDRIHGFPKASTELAGVEGAGFGQWIVVR